MKNTRPIREVSEQTT